MRIYTRVEKGVSIPLLIMIAILILSGNAAAGQASETDAWSEFQTKINQAGNGDVITLTGNLTSSVSNEAIIIPEGKQITIDLNGYTLNRNQIGNYTIRVLSGAVLTLRDSGATGCITGGYGINGGGIRNHGTLIMEGGCVTGNTAKESGGGIANYGMMTLVGGTVTGNTAMEEGGGIYNHAKAYLTIGGDFVFGNNAPKYEDIFNEGTLIIVDPETETADIQDMPVLRTFINMIGIIPTVILLFALTLAVLMDKYLNRERKRTMILVISLVFSLLLVSYLEYRISLADANSPMRTPLSVYCYAVRPAILAMFLYIVKPGRRYRIAWVLIGANAAVYLTAFFSGAAFHIAGGHFHSGPLYPTCIVVSGLIFSWLLVMTIQQFHPRKEKESILLILLLVFISGSVVLDRVNIFNEQPVTYLSIAIVISCVFYYIWLHLQFVRQHESDLMAAQRIQIMMMQIQPHFLFNALNTIRALYAKDPPLADQMLENFSMFLRQNLESLASPDLIPVSRELEHTKLYTQIEALRFPNIRIEYRIEDESFNIPALTIQPLVENAIRHGVRNRKDGCVVISTFYHNGVHTIQVKDNGEGFHPEREKSSEGTHIGLENVKERVEKMCRGKVSIESEFGKGTCIILMIPDKRP